MNDKKNCTHDTMGLSHTTSVFFVGAIRSLEADSKSGSLISIFDDVSSSTPTAFHSHFLAGGRGFDPHLPLRGE